MTTQGDNIDGALIDRSCSPLAMWLPWPLFLSSRANHCYCPRTILTPTSQTLYNGSAHLTHMWGNTLVDFTLIVAATRIEPVQLGHRMSMSLEVAVDRECHSGPKNLTASNCPHLLWQLLSSPNIHLGAEHGNARVSVRAAANPHPTGAFLSS